MPTYEYECRDCKDRFEHEQRISDAPLSVCPRCGGAVARLVSGGSGFLLRGGSARPAARQPSGGDCAFESTGTTCCGRSTRCDTPGCGGGR